jgi:hypothetical protein
MSKIIFLDIDGVLNDHKAYSNGYCGIKPSCVETLNSIIRASSADIVISSAWRYMTKNNTMTLQGLYYLLLIHGLEKDAKIVGVTQYDEIIPGRGMQILDWLEKHPIYRNYVVIDDGDDQYRVLDGMTLNESLALYHTRHWVKTRSDVGLTEQDANKAIFILGAITNVSPQLSPQESYGW